MVFMSRWRRFKFLEDEKMKLTKNLEGSATKMPENLNLCVSVTFLILISGFMVFCTTQTLKVAVLPLKPGTSWQPIESRVLHVEEERLPEQSLYYEQFEKNLLIRDVVIFPEDILLLIELPLGSSFLARKESLTCIFGSRSSSKVIGLEQGFGRVAVRCQIPLEGLEELSHGVALDQAHGAKSVLIQMPHLPKNFMTWNRLVFEILLTPTDVVLFAKGIIKKQGRSLNTRNLRCVFDDLVETFVTTAAQEVFRCLHPPPSMRQKLSRKRVTLKVNGILWPSVAYYDPYAVSSGKEPPGDAFELQLRPTQVSVKKHFICSCSMIFNGAKFLKEWVVYHAHLGVERFLLYDNNSEDNLEEAVKMLQSYNVTRHPWPWIKTQEAGFSYCALEAQHQCEWMIFTDVDEFLYPQFWIDRLSHKAHAIQAPILATLIKETLQNQDLDGSRLARKKIGQIQFNCLDFGPSGQLKHPIDGLMQGYTCRMAKKQRHKSIVSSQALSTSVLNVVHRFSLQMGYRSILLPTEKAVINHYKYQAWEEFKKKFRRRASAFVTDWKESKNLMSMDRTPGLGNQDIKPRDWEHRFCQVNDTAISDYAFKTFGPVALWQ